MHKTNGCYSSIARQGKVNKLLNQYLNIFNKIANEKIDKILTTKRSYDHYKAFSYAQKTYKELELFESDGIYMVEPDILIDEVKKDWRRFIWMANESSLISSTIEVFASFNEVSEIFYFENKPNTVEFFILLNKDKYDKKLMRRLISMEHTIFRMWDGKIVEIKYAPAKHVDRIQLQKYHIVYEKGKSNGNL